MTRVIDLDAVVRDYGIKAGRILVSPTNQRAEIVSVTPHKREIVMKVGDKIFPPADLGKLAYNLLNGKGSVVDAEVTK